MDIYLLIACATFGLLILWIVSEQVYKKKVRAHRASQARRRQREMARQAAAHRRKAEYREHEKQMHVQREQSLRKPHYAEPARPQPRVNATKTERGEPSERALVQTLLQTDIPREVIFHDLYVQKAYGKFSQPDVVVATPAGIIVFEVKEYSGWIFGKGHQRQWTQLLAYGERKNRFYNPIRQNQGHIEALRRQLNGFGAIPFYSVVVFYGNCELKDISFVPDNAFVIKSEQVLECVAGIRKRAPARYNNIMGMIEKLWQAVRNGENEQTRAQHLEYAQRIKEMFGAQ